MDTTLSTEVDGRNAGAERDVAVLVEGLFAFVVKGAKRIVQLSKGELITLKRLTVAFAEAPEDERGEILETILEVVLPEERIGGTAGKLETSKAVKENVEAARRFVGGKIRERREELGWTQKDLARKAQIPQSHVSRLERGKHAPTRITIERVAKAMNCNPSCLDPGYAEP